MKPLLVTKCSTSADPALDKVPKSRGNPSASCHTHHTDDIDSVSNNATSSISTDGEKIAKLDPHIHPAFRPPLPLPGGPSTLYTKPRQFDASRAAPRAHKPTYQVTWPVHPSPSVEAAINKFLHRHPLISASQHGTSTTDRKGIPPPKDPNQRETSTQTTTDRQAGPGLAEPTHLGRQFPPANVRTTAKPTTPHVSGFQTHPLVTSTFQPQVLKSSRPMYIIRGPDSHQQR